MDIVAAIHNSHEIADGPYTWTWILSGDLYTRAFEPDLIKAPYDIRVRDGDNRMLPVHSGG